MHVQMFTFRSMYVFLLMVSHAFLEEIMVNIAFKLALRYIKIYE